MRKIFKNLIAFLCVLSVIFSLCNMVLADEKLYNKYGYRENFEYKDEILAHALKVSVPKIIINFSAKLEYKPVKFNADLLEENLRDFADPDTGKVSHADALSVINDVEKNTEDYLTYSKAKTVNSKGSGHGSGVVISDNGYIATNAHVASISLNSHLEKEIAEDLTDVQKDLSKIGITLSNEQMSSLYDVVLADAITKAKIKKEKTKLTVCFPSADGNTNSDSAIEYEAEIVEKGTQEGSDGFTQDAAIIKIKADDLVALKLSETYPELNSKIVTAGFPGASDEIFQNAGSTESAMSITIGNGQVARLVPIDGQDYKAIEITATISGGNSGGPSVDSKLDIEGLNTYSLTADKRYAYMVPAEYVAELAEQFDMEQGEASLTFLTGLQMLQENHGSAAKECFERVEELQPDTPFIENMIELAENAPDEEYVPSTGKKTKKTIGLINIVGIVIGVVVFFVFVLILAAVVKVRMNSHKKYMDMPSVVNVKKPEGDINVLEESLPSRATAPLSAATAETASDTPVSTIKMHPVFKKAAEPGNEFISRPGNTEADTEVTEKITTEDIPSELLVTRIAPTPGAAAKAKRMCINYEEASKESTSSEPAETVAKEEMLAEVKEEPAIVVETVVEEEIPEPNPEPERKSGLIMSKNLKRDN